MSQKTYHFIGIGGIGMSGLARILLSKKIPVSGSDIAVSYTTEGLVKEGAVVHKGHSADLISPQMVVVYSSDIKKDNPEYLAAIQLQCQMLHRADLLAQLVHERCSLAVAGTHGKTTTSALLATVLFEADLDPSFAVGGMLPQFHANSRFGQGNYFAFEADESDRTFLKYHPYGAIVTNIDNDHLNNYGGSEKVLVDAFKTFMSQVKSPEHLFWCGDDAYLKQLNQPGQRYGFSSDCNWIVSNYRQKEFSIVFDIKGGGKVYRDVELAAIGRYNALNALAVFGLARTLDIDEQSIRKAFKSFRGVMRRCEKKGEKNGVLFIDDYAHHPTEIRETLQAIRQAVKERRLIAVFQPHRYSRTQDCLGQYGSIFEAVDELIITDIFAAGETPVPNLTHAKILDEVQAASSVRVQYVPRAALSHLLAQFVQPHDVVVTLGAGDVTKVGPETLTYLEKQAPRRFKVGLIFGGSLAEHEVSISSSENFRQSLNHDYYEVQELGITKQGTWLSGPHVKQQLQKLVAEREKDPSHSLSEDALKLVKQCDVLIPVLHGPLGEDGMVQGLFEVLNKAYVGCDHRAAAVCMDKVLCKKLAGLEGIRTAPFVDFSSHDWRIRSSEIVQEIKERLHFPVYVKPTHLGSSVGIKKVVRIEDLAAAIDYAFQFDAHVLVENGIVGRELEFAVLGNDEVHTFPPGEIFTGGATYDYHDKYAADGMKTSACAVLSPDLVEEGEHYATKVYQTIGCSGLARVDFFLDRDGKFWFNEINPMPGFTPTSLYPMMCAHSGLKTVELMDRLIILALQRKRQQDRIQRMGLMALKR